MATNVRDPRSIVTPDAFAVDPSLLGIPLAAPGRRAFALLIDLIVIGTLTAITSSVALLVWGAVAIFLVSMAFRRPGEATSQVTAALFRGATGCLGLTILLGVGIGFLALRTGEGSRSLERALESLDTLNGALDVEAGEDAAPGVGALLRGLSGAAELRQADDTAEAREAMEDLLVTMVSSGVAPGELAEAATGLDALMPADAPWRDEAPLVRERALRSALERTAPADAEPGDDLPAAEVRADIPPEVQALVADTLGRLADSLEGARTRETALRSELDEAREELQEAREEGGFIALVSDIWGQLGSAIGLWSVYFTVALTLTQGRTVGKKALGIRAIRLDGKPITWWFAFERAGGYAAGIATGLLGFAQVWWDPNRQCVHDKIGGTVVVVDGATPIPGAWQEAWHQQQAEG